MEGHAEGHGRCDTVGANKVVKLSQKMVVMKRVGRNGCWCCGRFRMAVIPVLIKRGKRI